MTAEDRPPIRLDQFLKQQGAVGTGGHAKIVIQAGEVTVNGAVETRRRKQLAPGDIVAYAGEQWCVGATQES
ncbi:RNA-binding S4 domain-containing protein [Gimesia panareensis]|uniref:RNA-binding S4 domain-containing protein n=1 Tax=Gimesia panareensis TaxID=2527978 RepID=UPI00118CD179|nr:RNA-binding S4 domain-containing protein [Gimesia panareensis]QDU48173.1 ribosome-associated protein [Gimesia panareensis]